MNTEEHLNEEWMDDDEDLTEEESAEKIVRLDMVVDKNQEATRVDKFIMTKIEGATRNKIQQGIQNDLVLINGESTRANYKVRPGDHILVYDNKPNDYHHIIPQKMDLDIVYEDDDFMLINKPAGLVVHPGSGNPNGTLVNGVAHYIFGPVPEEEIRLNRVGLVHRIDKDTTGLILIAKTEEALLNLTQQFKDKKVHRRYMALVWGNLKEDEGTIEGHIGRNIRHRKLMEVYPDGRHGKEAITHYRVVERLHYVNLVEFQLETGRTHQIRVHAKYLGHTLFADETYGGDKILKGTVYAKYKQFVEGSFKILNRQALHAYELGFKHPRTGEKMFFQQELPEDMQKVIERWRTYINAYRPED